MENCRLPSCPSKLPYSKAGGGQYNQDLSIIYFQLFQQINLKQTVHGAHGRNQIVPQHVVQKHFEHAVEA